MHIRTCAVTDLDEVQAIYAHHVRTGLGTFEEVPPSVAEMRRRFDSAAATICRLNLKRFLNEKETR